MELKNYYDVQKLKEKRDTIKKIFFYRICGTGMGACACLLKEAGLEVAGGDNQFYPPMSTYLKASQLPLYNLQDFSFLTLSEYDLIVVGNVVPKESFEAREIEKSGVPFCSFPAALGGLVLETQNVVGVAGTHGKTTTTYFLVQILESLGLSPGYLIGGVLEGRPSARVGDGSYFIIEADEYDCSYFEKISKFRQYAINHLILTSLEFDHGDIFDSLDDIIAEFLHVTAVVDKSFIACSDYEGIKALKINEKVERKLFYGESLSNTPKIRVQNSEGCEFDLFFEGELISFKTNLIGRHNILNLSAGLLFCLGEGFSVLELQKSILELQLVKRRQEERGYYKKTLIIDDFAHHPKAVYYTLDGLKTKYLGKKMIVFMEPNSATARSNLFENAFIQALKIADKSILIRPKRSTTIERFSDIDCEKMSQALKNSSVARTLQDLKLKIEENIGENNVLVFLSNGTCLGLWESEFAKNIEN